MAAHVSLPVACVQYCHCIYLESAVANEEPQKVSEGASPHCLSWMSKSQSRNRHRAVKARDDSVNGWPKFLTVHIIVHVYYMYFPA